jgi:hypothetical protein
MAGMKEKIRPSAISEESRIRGIILIRKVFEEEGLTSGNDSFWIAFESRVRRLRSDDQSLRDACFEYWRVGHMLPGQAAKMLLNEIPNFRSGEMTGDITEEQSQEYINRLAGELFDFYPENVKDAS